ncbi:hypothetical protein BA895_14415 [Humibacillus sp. DSM 29435]|uniref:hypothetical protein n=1 Tax=Humibacillus sp. DSM 29435 TaxID=1869167 RepID=UPI000871E412|nr:hypothetical protein [Humibacillus sp. DSM 29435]OFE17690.1 hypothetical protein BA895_14415 [Humibacillus sp. DSM 29435]
MNVTRSPFFLSTVLFLGGALSFQFDDSGVAWSWSGRAWIGAVLLLCSGVFAILLFRSTRRSARA